MRTSVCWVASLRSRSHSDILYACLQGDYYQRNAVASPYARNGRMSKAQQRRTFLKWGIVGLIIALFVMGIVAILSPDSKSPSLASTDAATAQSQELLADAPARNIFSDDVVDINAVQSSVDVTATPAAPGKWVKQKRLFDSLEG